MRSEKEMRWWNLVGITLASATTRNNSFCEISMSCFDWTTSALCMSKVDFIPSSQESDDLGTQ